MKVLVKARSVAVGGALLLGLVGAAQPASAAGPVVSAPLVTDLAGPLGLSVVKGGPLYVSQAFAGLVTRIDRDGSTHTVASRSYEIAGVEAQSDGSIVMTTQGGGQNEAAGRIERVAADGTSQVLANLTVSERKKNPDGSSSYGFQGLTPECAAQVPPQVGGESYTGRHDSHPYAITSLSGGTYAVADAGANAILRVLPGRLTTEVITVLPPQPTVVAGEVAAGLGLPDCVVGAAYNFEPVPTDVELGQDGQLYVSTLPGGPEDASLGARGSVYRVDPTSGAITRIATGFLGATDLAVSGNGRIYVAELFGNRISYVKNGAPATLVELNQPAALEWSGGRLYAAYDALSSGKVARITP